MFESIIKWGIENRDSLINGVIGNAIFGGLIKLWTIKNKVPKVVKTIINIKGIKYLGFIILFILPIGTIVWMILDKTIEPTFKNIALFIIICFTLIFNILVRQVIIIYEKLILSIKSQNAIHKQYSKNFDTIYEEIIELKKQIEKKAEPPTAGLQKRGLRT